MRGPCLLRQKTTRYFVLTLGAAFKTANIVGDAEFQRLVIGGLEMQAGHVLEFATKGDVAESMSVRGDLYLFKEKGVWKVFGYDVDQAVPL